MAGLVKRFTGNTYGMSLRPAGKLIGVKAPTIQALREWYDGGARPEDLSIAQKTIDGVRAYMAVADEVETRRAALRIAAERLDEMARRLREEAGKPDAGALATSAAEAGAVEQKSRTARDKVRPQPPTRRAGGKRP